MYYITKKTADRTVIAGYMSKETAEKYNPGATAVEDNIYSEDVGFPIEGLLVVGYLQNCEGTYATTTKFDNNNPFIMYARTPSGDWTPVGSYKSGGMSYLTAGWAEAILVGNNDYIPDNPKDVIGKLEPGKVTFVQQIRWTKNSPFSGDL